jgi:hypothetical protein
LVLNLRIAKSALKAVFVAVGDKYLTKYLASHDSEQLRHTTHIEFVEQVVKKKYRSLVAMLRK